MNLAIQILASYPPSGKEKGYEAQPSGGVSAHYEVANTFNELTTKI